MDFGWISEGGPIFDPGNFFTGLGLGVRIRNESLLFSTLQIRLAYYPREPNNGDQFDVDFHIRNPRLFRNFRTAKPEVVRFE